MRQTLLFVATLLVLGIVAPDAHAQTPADTARLIILSPVVGEVIDAQEKATYGLFPYYSTDSLAEGRLYRALRPDSTVTLLTRFRDGNTRRRIIGPEELQAARAAVARPVALPAQTAVPQAKGAQPDSIGTMYSVELRSGNSFVGTLAASRPAALEFTTRDLGRITVQRDNIRSMQPLTVEQTRRGWDPVGNGTRLFFAPTARMLRKGEGYVQDVNIFLIGANYGITDYFSVGALVPVLPGTQLSLVALTPKVGVPVTEKVNLAAGVLFVTGFGSSAGIAYGAGTYGTADQNATLGLGYLFAEGEVESSPVVLVGGAARISRRISLVNETYIFDGGLGGLAGVRMAAARLSGSLGFLYLSGLNTIFPAYLEAAYRFGKVK
ncbi:hypothetical protein [Hymenobacter latericus]|uniref:hypothetical protein n=1 Tax=Hymenobacter sp. YIM 151858-1 TaxID=2987688 RepID=UPI00222763A9|nr:hypothetical protein [Hymenobacter sp. YIM 151858-1]UYZ58096.1 hypothetical protein OIS50_13635 [Hymenobacter sp. YIM 151858-1]